MKNNIYLSDLEYFLPKKIESNFEILKKNKKSNIDAFKMIKKIGIKNRRVVDQSVTSNLLAEKVAQKIFKKYNKDKIDFLIYCTNSPDFILPPNSCYLQNKLKLKKNIGCFDINLSCSGFIYSLGVAKSLIISNQANNILLITSDTYSKFINKKDYKNRIIFGDGSTACVISRKRGKFSYNIMNFLYGTDGGGGKNAIFKNFGTKYLHNKQKEVFDMNGPEILNFALKEVPISVLDFLNKNNIKLLDIDKYIFHQANKFIIQSLQQKLSIPDDKLIIEMDNSGNTVSSSIPIALKKIEKKI